MLKKVFITCKLINQDAFYFTRPVADIDEVEEVIVFRDNQGMKYKKVKYISPNIKIHSFCNIIIRFFQMLFSKKRNLKLIIGIYEIPHGMLAVIIGKILNTPSVVCIIGNPAYTPIRKGFRKKITYIILKKATYITTTGNNSKAFLINEGFSSDKIKVLPNSIDVDYFHPSTILKKYDLITVGRISPEKQLNIFVEVVEKLAKNNKNIKAAIAGSGPEFNIIQTVIIEKGLENNITMLGFVEGDNLRDLFSQGKIYLSCSQTEGFPRTIIQSLACGTPCVSSNVGDLTDTIIEGVNGYLVNDSCDVKNYVEKITCLLNSSEIYKSFSNKGREIVSEKYSYIASTKLWESILSEL